MKILLTFICIITLMTSANAQKAGSIVLNAYGGYTFKDKLNFEGFYGYVDEAFQYGGGLEFFLQSTRAIEIKYVRMDTHLPIYRAGGTKLNEGNDNGSVSYLLVGSNNYFGDLDGKVMGFGGGSLGAGFTSMHNGGNGTHFAYDIHLGIKGNTASPVSYKLMAYMQSMISSGGSDFYTTAGGAIISVPDYTSILQFGLTAILAFDFKHSK
jgi:hypothetical protein